MELTNKHIAGKINYLASENKKDELYEFIAMSFIGIILGIAVALSI